MGLFNQNTNKKQITPKQAINKNNKPTQPVIKKPVITKKPAVKKEKDIENILELNNKNTTTLEVYDWLLSNIFAKNLLIKPDVTLNDDEIGIEWGRIISKNTVSKLFVIEKFGNWQPFALMELLKEATIKGLYSIRYNYFIDGEPHSIDWTSAKMQRERRAFQASVNNRALNGEDNEEDLVKRRENFAMNQKQNAKGMTFSYFDDNDLKFRRSISKNSFLIQIIGDIKNLEELETAVAQFKGACISCNIQINELKADIFNWWRLKNPISMRSSAIPENKIPKTVMSDDTLSVLLGSGQGIIGDKGCYFGSDIYSGLPVFHIFREDKNAAENILVSAQTGGGKSVFVKNVIFGALVEGLSVCVLDLEGDEYTNIAKLLNEGKPKEAVVIDMSSGKGKYFDPLRIADLTGDEELDKTAKSDSAQFTMSMFKVLLNNDVSIQEDAILSQVITRVYSEHGISDDPITWKRSKTLNINMVYETLNRLVEQRKQFIDPSGDDTLQKVAKNLLLRLRKYFVKGELEYGTFGEILELDPIKNARFICFSFGNHGRDQQGADQTKLALKQLCVSKITNEISNYNQYVKHKFTLKIWEEVQRFVSIPGAQDIMKNCITGGRKRGDISFIVSNDLASILKGEGEFFSSLKDNLTGYCIGFIGNKETREKFCKDYDLINFQKDLDEIYKATALTLNKSSSGEIIQSPFKNSFLLKFKPAGKSAGIETIAKPIIDPKLFSRGIYDQGKLDKDIL